MTTRYITVLDVLLGAAALLESENRYTPIAGRGGARDANGAVCSFGTARAHAFTLGGACKRALRDLGGTTQAELRLARTAVNFIQADLPHTHIGGHRGFDWYSSAWSLITFDDISRALDAAILGDAPPALPLYVDDDPEPVVDDLCGLNVRAGNALRHRGIVPLAQLIEFRRDELAALPGVGPGTLANIEIALARHGLSLQRGVRT